MSMTINGTSGVTFPNSTVQASAGSVLQVVNATYGTQVTTSSGTFSDTGLTATITPKFATSKILAIVSQNGCGKYTGDLTIQLKLQRNGSDLIVFAGQGDYTANGATNYGYSHGCQFLDSPATTSAVTYKTVFAAYSPVPTAVVQSSLGLPSVSTMVLLEIAG